MDFKQLQSFVAVAKYKSFSVAAEKLFLSQPTVSTHIRLLEEELESRLIIRSPKYLELTPRGVEFYDYAVSTLNLRDNLLTRWSDHENTIIRISASTLPATYILPEVLPGFSGLHPNTYFHITQSDSAGVLQDVMADRCSIGLTGMFSDSDKLECIPFYEDSMVIITPVTEHFLALRTQGMCEIETLLQEPIILRESKSGVQKRADKLLQNRNIREEELNVVARVNDPETVKNLVSGGMGISLISHKAARNLEQEKRILVFPIEDSKMLRTLYLVYKKDYIFQKNILAFIEYLKRFYQ